MKIVQILRMMLWKTGFDVVKFKPTSHPITRRKMFFKLYDIDLVLDVGANTGQFAEQARHFLDYNKKIISFEPMSNSFDDLQEKATSDPLWEPFQIALGDENGSQVINIAGNSYSSSLLDMLETHLNSAPESRYIGTEEIEVKTLDSIFSDLCVDESNIFLKIDTQGFESKVLKGAENSLNKIHTIQIEMSLVPLYKDEMVFDDMCLLLREKGYTLVALEPGFGDAASGQHLEVDGIFHRF